MKKEEPLDAMLMIGKALPDATESKENFLKGIYLTMSDLHRAVYLLGMIITLQAPHLFQQGSPLAELVAILQVTIIDLGQRIKEHLQLNNIEVPNVSDHVKSMIRDILNQAENLPEEVRNTLLQRLGDINNVEITEDKDDWAETINIPESYFKDKKFTIH